MNEAQKINRYVHLLKPWQAVMAYLRDEDGCKGPLPEDEIVKGLCECNWQGGGKLASATLHRSIKNHTDPKGTGFPKKRIKRVNGLIGLYAWDDSLFYSGGELTPEINRAMSRTIA